MDINKAYNYCIRLLSISDRTSAEIIKKLKQRDFTDDIINVTISKLENYGYINDENYIERWLKDKSNQPGMSKKMMYYKLLQKGLNKDLLNNKFTEISIDDYDTALAAAEKKLKSLKGDTKIIRNKLFSFLIGKGYSIETYNRIVCTLFEQG